MSQSSSSVSAVDSSNDRGGLGGHPKGLTPLFFTEMWERFSYYGMRALLTLFMVASLEEGGLGYSTERMGFIYGTYTMAVYLLGIVGGFLADNFIGSRRAVLYGGIVIACGHFSMAVVSEATFLLGLVLISVGTGLLKPNISTMVGSLYSPSDIRRDSGFSIFYMGINLGSLCAPIVCGWLAQSAMFKGWLAAWGLNPAHSWHWGFAAAGVGMVLGLIIYLRMGHRLAHVGRAPARAPGESGPWGKLALVTLGAFALVALMSASDRRPWIIQLVFGVHIAAIVWFGTRRDPVLKRIGAILFFVLGYEIFCAVFEQAGSTIALFGDELTRTSLFGHDFPSSWFQSLNPMFVLLLAPIFAWLWIRLGTRQPSSPLKFSLSLAVLALSFALMVPAAKLTADGLVSPWWLVLLFFLQTVSEMCLSPVGLSTMTKLAPAQLVGVVMGLWFVAASLGNKLSGVMAGQFTASDPGALADFFLHQAMWVGAAAVGFFIITPWIRRLMGGVR
ncbi:MAG: hypothetical protein RIS54_1563 [Verrucomicrobiota bacterium]|jgi:POT family proton-dependent oligopeptide transporter